MSQGKRKIKQEDEEEDEEIEEPTSKKKRSQDAPHPVALVLNARGMVNSI